MTRLGSDTGPALFGLPVQRREVVDTPHGHECSSFSFKRCGCFCVSTGPCINGLRILIIVALQQNLCATLGVVGSNGRSCHC